MYDLEESSPGLVQFKQTWAAVPRANGDVSADPVRSRRKDAGKGFKWNAVRFSHKVYAVFHAAQTVTTPWLLWMDADTVCHSVITEEFLDVVMKFTDEETAEDFLLTIYNQLNYIGRTPLNPKIVQQLFQHVLELINLSFKDFSTAYAYLNETIGNEIRAEKERKLALNFKMPSMYADDHPLKTMKRKLVSATAGSNTRRKLPTKK